MNLKAGHEFEQRHLEAEFGQSKFFEPHLRGGGVKQMYNCFQPNFKKNPDFEFVSKSYNRFTEPPLSYGFEGVVPTRIGH
jgi:hypothetical protein